jgi:hypothetical protein
LDASTNPNSLKVIVLLTDGKGTLTACSNPSSPAAEACRKGYLIYTVALGSNSVAKPLIDISDCTGGTPTAGASVPDILSVLTTLFGPITVSTAPHDIDVEEIVPPGVIVKDTTPDATVTFLSDGRTKIVWSNVDGGAGLPTGVTKNLTFTAAHSKVGLAQPVNDDSARVLYSGLHGCPFPSVDIPDITIDVTANCDALKAAAERAACLAANKCSHLSDVFQEIGGVFPGVIHHKNFTRLGRCVDHCIWNALIDPIKVGSITIPGTGVNHYGWECGPCP